MPLGIGTCFRFYTQKRVEKKTQSICIQNLQSLHTTVRQYNIKLVKLDFSKLIFQKSSTDQQGVILYILLKSPLGIYLPLRSLKYGGLKRQRIAESDTALCAIFPKALKRNFCQHFLIYCLRLFIQKCFIVYPIFTCHSYFPPLIST